MALFATAHVLNDDAGQRSFCDNFVDDHAPCALMMSGMTGINWGNVKDRLWAVVTALKTAGVSWPQILAVLGQITSMLFANSSAAVQTIVNAVMDLLGKLFTTSAPVQPVNMPGN